MVVETLNVAGMMRNRRLAKSLADGGMSGFLSKLKYRSQWYGAELIEASRWYLSSKLCGCCGKRNESLTLSQRQWACGSCDRVNDRNLNAALNLVKAGFELPGVRTWRPCKTGYVGGGR